MALLSQIFADGFPCGPPVASDLDAFDISFADAFADVIFREAAKLGSLLHRDQVSKSIR